MESVRRKNKMIETYGILLVDVLATLLAYALAVIVLFLGGGIKVYSRLIFVIFAFLDFQLEYAFRILFNHYSSTISISVAFVVLLFLFGLQCYRNVGIFKVKQICDTNHIASFV